MHSLLLFAAIAFSSNFAGGSGRAEWPEPAHLRMHVEGEADQDGRNRQANWYYFRLDGVAGRKLTIDLTDLVGEYNYNAGTHAVQRVTYPVYSYDNRHWRQFPAVEWDDDKIEMRLLLEPQRDTVWIAHVPPYTIEHLERLAAEADGNPYLERVAVGKTVEGRDMPLWTITDPDVAVSAKKTVWLMFRQHSWEAGSSWAADGALRFLLSDDPTAARMRREVVWKIFPMADPDGVERGGVRFNKNGYDINRNWDVKSPKLMPEITAQRKAIADWLAAGHTVDLFLSLHNTETSEYLEGPPKFHDLTDRFRRNLVAMTTFHPTRAEPRDAPVSSTPGLKGRMTVNQGLFAEFGIPSMLMEQMIAFNTRLGGFPKIDDRRRFGAGLVRAAWKTVVP